MKICIINFFDYKNAAPTKKEANAQAKKLPLISFLHTAKEKLIFTASPRKNIIYFPEI